MKRTNRNGTRARLGAGAAGALLLVACGGGGDDAASDSQGLGPPGFSGACANRVNNTVDKLLHCVTLAGVRRHQAALQSIADANQGTRASGTLGYDQSATYAERVLRRAGYVVTRQEFQFQAFLSLSPSLLEQVSPAPAGPVANVILEYSGSADVTAPVSALPGPGADPTPGCEAGDFAGFPQGRIALISRGACTYAAKVLNAVNAGAAGVVVYNNVPGPINGTLGSAFNLNVGVTTVTQAVGERLAARPGLVMRLKTETFRGLATTSNVIAESRDGDSSQVVMVGGHLDSVNAGPGINDNGSGSAAVLETAVQMAKVKPRNKLRFGLWGAEEAGLLGSAHYVNSLLPAERDRIALYLNFDMIGSPNHVFFIYDGDDSDRVGAGPGPEGSARIEQVFEAFFRTRGLPFKGTDFSGRSDYGPFIAAGIPAGGLFTGAEGIKTAPEAALWGGTAGRPYDPCYHQACDGYANNNDVALDVNSDAVAYATLTLAMDVTPLAAQRRTLPRATPALAWPEHPPSED